MGDGAGGVAHSGAVRSARIEDSGADLTPGGDGARACAVGFGAVGAV